MALINCPECNASISDRAIACPACGYPIAPTEVESAMKNVTMPTPMVTVTKSRGIYIILGVLFGCLGIHDFYADYYGRGAIKLVLMTLTATLDASTGFHTGFVIFAFVINGIWTLVDICSVNKDRSGKRMS